MEESRKETEIECGNEMGHFRARSRTHWSLKEAAGGCGDTGGVCLEGVLTDWLCGHSPSLPGRLRQWSVEKITSLQGKAGNWWNTDFTEGWPENPWLTPSGWEPGCPHLGLGNRSPWRRGGGGGHLTLLLFLSQKLPPVAPRTMVRGAPCL